MSFVVILSACPSVPAALPWAAAALESLLIWDSPSAPLWCSGCLPFCTDGTGPLFRFVWHFLTWQFSPVHYLTLGARRGPLSRYWCRPGPLGEGGLFLWGFAALFSLCGKRKSWGGAFRWCKSYSGLWPRAFSTGDSHWRQVLLWRGSLTATPLAFLAWPSSLLSCGLIESLNRLRSIHCLSVKF